MRSVFSLAFILITSISCSQKSEKLVWSDEFDGVGAPDTSKWSYNLGSSGWGNNEVQNYSDDLTNSRQENGKLIIQAIKKDGSWTSARLVTEKKFEFTYGKVVFRAKLPSGSGTWPALWMLGNNADKLGWPGCGEIDVMEHVGRRPAVIQAAMHTPSSYGNTVNLGYTSVEDYDTEFHLYEANWTPDKIEFSVDDKLFYTYNPAVKDKETWPLDHPFFIIVNIAMGGNFGSDPKFETNNLKNGIDPSLEKVTMEIDYIRVYQLDKSN
jgi:beta-glucanase (GH16 family)